MLSPLWWLCLQNPSPCSLQVRKKAAEPPNCQTRLRHQLMTVFETTQVEEIKILSSLFLITESWPPALRGFPGGIKGSESESRSVVSDSLPPHGLYSPWRSPGQNAGVGSLSLLQGLFPAQGSNPGLQHCRKILYQLSHKGSPPACKCRRYKRCGFNPGLGRPPGEGHGNTLQYPSLENPMGRGAWQAMVHRVAQNRTRLKWLSTYPPTLSLYPF